MPVAHKVSFRVDCYLQVKSIIEIIIAYVSNLRQYLRMYTLTQAHTHPHAHTHQHKSNGETYVLLKAQGT